MPISYPLSLPSVRIRQIVLRGTSATSSSESPFTFQEQIQVFPGQRWSATITLPPMKRAEADLWTAFMLSLNGREGTFLMGDPAAAQPKGSMGGDPTVDGNSQTGNELNIMGCPNNIVGWGKKGDYIQFTTGGFNRLHMLLADADTNGTGRTTLLLWPRLRTSPAHGEPIITTNTKGQWRLAQSYSEKTIDIGANYGQSFACVEAL